QEHQRLPKVIALATFSSDAISSTAYATEEILAVTAIGASSLALGLAKLVPIAIVVAIVLAIVSFSYRQTIFAYPSGGGSYIVSISTLAIIGLTRTFFGHVDPIHFDPHRAENIKQIGGNLSLFILLRGFSSGAVALTGVEAISNGVPAFKKPESKNAATKLT